MFPVSVVKCGSYDRAEVQDAVNRSVALLGGISKFVPAGSRVLVKPNLLYPRAKESAVTTHPEVVRAVVKLLEETNAAEVLVGDSPGLARGSSAAKACGLLEAISDTSATFVEFDEVVEVKGGVFPKLVLAKHVVEADVVIDVAKAKTHGHTRLTLTTKNLFGCVPGKRKSQWHLRAGKDERMFARLIVDIANTVKPALCVLDAVVAMEGNGPGSGTPRKIGALMAGTSPAAVDMAAARMLGFSREELPLEQAAVEMGLGPAEMDEVEVLGDGLDAFRVEDFKRSRPGDLKRLRQFGLRFPVRLPGVMIAFLERFATPRPEVREDICRRCGRCAEICPPAAISMQNDVGPVIDRSACIRCFCCQEICPFGAIAIRENLLARWFAR